MQRMSDMLSRWLEGATRQSRQEAEGTTAGQARATTSQTDNVASSSRSSPQSAASSSASVPFDGEQPSTSRESDYSTNQAGSSTNQSKKIRSASSDESMAGRALSSTLVGPSGAGAREMVCRLAKQLTFDVAGPTTRELHCGGNLNTHGEEGSGSSKIVADGNVDLRKCELEHDIAVKDDVVVSNVMSLTDTDNQRISPLADTNNDATDKQGVSSLARTDDAVTDRQTDQQMEDVSHETKLGDVAGTELTANSDISYQDLHMQEPSVSRGDTTVDCARRESECSTKDVRQDVNSDQSIVTENSITIAGYSAEDDKTACDADRLSGVNSFINTMVEVDDDAAVNRSRSGSSQAEKTVHQAPSSVSSVKRRTERSTSELHPDLGALVDGRRCTQSKTPGEGDRNIHAEYSVQSQDGTTNHQLTPPEQSPDVAENVMSTVGTDFDMSATSAVDSGSDLSTCSAEDYDALKGKTLSAETCSITDRPHKPLPISTTDLEEHRCHSKADMSVNSVEHSDDGTARDSADSAPVQASEEDSSIQFTDESMKISISGGSDDPSPRATWGESRSVGPRAAEATGSAISEYCLF